jgi:hypothetical protein
MRGLDGQLTTEEVVPTHECSGARAVRQAAQRRRNSGNGCLASVGGLSGGGGGDRFWGRRGRETMDDGQGRSLISFPYPTGAAEGTDVGIE